MNIGVNRDDFWNRLCVAMGRPDLGVDERYATYMERAKRQSEVHDITEQFTRQHTRAEIEHKLGEVDVPVSGILSMAEVIENDYLKQRGSLCQVDDGLGGSLTLPSDPTGFKPAPGALRIPNLGEHRNALLQDKLGLNAEQIAQLEQAGAFGQHKPQ